LRMFDELRYRGAKTLSPSPIEKDLRRYGLPTIMEYRIWVIYWHENVVVGDHRDPQTGFAEVDERLRARTLRSDSWLESRPEASLLNTLPGEEGRQRKKQRFAP